MYDIQYELKGTSIESYKRPLQEHRERTALAPFCLLVGLNKVANIKTSRNRTSQSNLRRAKLISTDRRRAMYTKQIYIYRVLNSR